MDGGAFFEQGGHILVRVDAGALVILAYLLLLNPRDIRPPDLT
ncbi:hypothetical protein SAMN05216554_4517 [Herbiconiux ginsengi]|uniref:Uncharacterized protein n=2 Tax=Herbiconiux ginsengi TaxID=381665 RepID=A0A1H3TVM3_9MICO|nr:hypothetical protein SAMN05216554_4517 [Herbiconiux ginsengi]